MLPIRDINPTSSRPIVNYGLIAANVVMFLWVATLPPSLVSELALIPGRFAEDPAFQSYTIFSSMFMHANLSHLLGNMLFLWIFGDNIEDAIGHGRYIVFYLVGGLVAAIAQLALSGMSPIPIVGASGAIAAVTGAYLLLYPRAPVLMLNPFPPLWLFLGFTFVVPAWFVVGEFFVTNLFMGLATLGEQAMTGVQGRGGVAVFAHLGGFVAGIVMVRPMMRGRRPARRRAWDGWRPPPRSRRW